MSDPGEDWPDPLSAAYELRFTLTALDDLRARGADPGDMDSVRDESTYSDVVTKFVKMRTLDPAGTAGTAAGPQPGTTGLGRPTAN